MKIKSEKMDSDDCSRQPLSGTSVHNRFGRSWTRAESRLDKNSRWNKRESPRKVKLKLKMLNESFGFALDYWIMIEFQHLNHRFMLLL